jgi:2'-hydroxyisoflavone reductase
VFISAVSVYGDPASGPVDETQARLPPAEEDVTEITSETYGRLKVTCEDIVGALYGDRCACLRPQIVAGPYDPFDRFSYWVRRAGQGGEMLAPGDGSDYVQTIDARDVARFTRIVCERALPGVFNLAGPRLTWADFLCVLGAKSVVWMPADVIRRAGVTEFELPLYRPLASARSRLMHVSNDRAVRAGLTLTNPAVTARDVRAWLDKARLQPALTLQREAELIAAAKGTGSRLPHD